MGENTNMMPIRGLLAVLRGIWLVIQFIGAFLYYVITEIFADPFIAIKPIKIAAKWLYENCQRFPILSLYFAYLVRPEGKAPIFTRLSQIPWVVAIPPALIVSTASLVKLFALSLSTSRPALAVTIFIGAKIAIVPVALRTWEEVRPVVRKDFLLRQVDNVVQFLFHDLPLRAKAIVQERMAQMRRIMAPIRERVREITRPARERLRAVFAPMIEALRPLGQRMKAALKAWIVGIRAWSVAVRESIRAFFARRPGA